MTSAEHKDAAHAIRCYNRATQRLNGIRGTYPIRHTRRSLRIASELVAWCKANDLDVDRWIRARHEAIGWKFRISLKCMIGATDEYLIEYREWREVRVIEKEIDSRTSLAVVPDTSRVHDLTVLGDVIKESYSDEPDLCYGISTGPDPLSGGWHPESEWCQKCPRADDCRSALSPMVRRCRERPSLDQNSSGS